MIWDRHHVGIAKHVMAEVDLECNTGELPAC